MKPLAFALFIGVLIRHFSNAWFNTYLGIKWWFYVWGGVWEVFLCAALAAMVWHYEKTKWRLIALYALGIGICEGLQMVVCRVLIFDISSMPKGVNTCDYLTGLHVTTSINTLYLLILALIVGAILRAKKSSS